MSLNDSEWAQIRILGSLRSFMDGQLQKLIQQNEELENNLNSLVVTVPVQTLLLEQLKEVRTDLQSSSRKLKDLRRAIYTELRTQVSWHIGNKQVVLYPLSEEQTKQLNGVHF